MLLLLLWTKKCQDWRWVHVRTAVRAKKFSFKKYPTQSNTPFSGHLWQSIPLSCWTSLRNLNVMKKTETAVKLLRRKINVLSNIYLSKVSTSTSGYLWQSMPQSSCINYKHADVSKKTGCTEFFLKLKNNY